MLELPPQRKGTHFMGTLFMIAKIRDAHYVQSYGAHNVSDPIFLLEAKSVSRYNLSEEVASWPVLFKSAEITYGLSGFIWALILKARGNTTTRRFMETKRMRRST
ncbi:hypothetical protein CULT_450032 [[Clostridium] ultunense Esp]|nr:hypothetical protein CULT_450032 [[Clostridium] ultunense Esp]